MNGAYSEPWLTWLFWKVAGTCVTMKCLVWQRGRRWIVAVLPTKSHNACLQKKKTPKCLLVSMFVWTSVAVYPIRPSDVLHQRPRLHGFRRHHSKQPRLSYDTEINSLWSYLYVQSGCRIGLPARYLISDMRQQYELCASYSKCTHSVKCKIVNSCYLGGSIAVLFHPLPDCSPQNAYPWGGVLGD